MSTHSTLGSIGAKETLKTTTYFYVEATYEGSNDSRQFVVFTKNKRAAEDLAARFAMQIAPGNCEVADMSFEKNAMIETSTDLVTRGLYVIE